MRILPPARTDRRRAAKRPGKAAAAKRGYNPPKLFVQLFDRGLYAKRFVPAQIKVRRQFYRYLVWTEDGRKRELYLGKVKILAPADRRPAPARASSCRSSSSSARGGKK